MLSTVIRAALVAGVTTTMLAIGPADAGAQWNPSLVVKLGATLPVGEFGDAVSTGYNVGIGAAFARPTSPVGVRLELDFHENGLDNIDDVDWRHVAGIANLTYRQPGSSVFLIGGVGLYRSYINVDDELGEDDDDLSETNVGINAGAGLNFNLTGFSTFLEARFHHQFAEGEAIQFIPISFGVRF